MRSIPWCPWRWHHIPTCAALRIETCINLASCWFNTENESTQKWLCSDIERGYMLFHAKHQHQWPYQPVTVLSRRVMGREDDNKVKKNTNIADWRCWQKIYLNCSKWKAWLKSTPLTSERNVHWALRISTWKASCSVFCHWITPRIYSAGARGAPWKVQILSLHPHAYTASFLILLPHQSVLHTGATQQEMPIQLGLMGLHI